MNCIQSALLELDPPAYLNSIDAASRLGPIRTMHLSAGKGANLADGAPHTAPSPFPLQ